MKIWGIVIGVIFICAMVSSPALAISKSDLIAKYQSMNIGVVPADLCGSCGTPTTIPTAVPTQVPTGTGTGTLSVGSLPGGSKVYLDGEYRGVTPVTIADGTGPLILSGVSAGPHQLMVTKEGYKDYAASVTVTGGETTSVIASLFRTGRVFPISPPETPTTVPTSAPTPTTPGTGIVSISSYPEGAVIYLDGAFKGYSPITLTGVPVGGHQIRMTMAGLPDYRNSVWVVAGVPASVVATFTSAKGDIIAGYGVDLPPCKRCQPILEG
jgi:hypothetical protein